MKFCLSCLCEKLCPRLDARNGFHVPPANGYISAAMLIRWAAQKVSLWQIDDEQKSAGTLRT